MPEIPTTIIWAVIGLLLIIIEVFTTSFFLLFFGIGALLVSGIKLLGLENLPIEIVICAVLGLAGTLLFRNRIVANLKSDKPVNIDKEKTIKLTEDIAVGDFGSIRHHGAPWKAKNISDEPLKAGDNVTIDSIDGVTILLKKKV